MNSTLKAHSCRGITSLRFGWFRCGDLKPTFNFCSERNCGRWDQCVWDFDREATRGCVDHNADSNNLASSLYIFSSQSVSGFFSKKAKLHLSVLKWIFPYKLLPWKITRLWKRKKKEQLKMSQETEGQQGIFNILTAPGVWNDEVISTQDFEHSPRHCNFQPCMLRAESKWII